MAKKQPKLKSKYFYIYRFIKSKYPKKYVERAHKREISSFLLKKVKETGVKLNNQNLISILRSEKIAKKAVEVDDGSEKHTPYLHFKLLERQEYFNIIDYPKFIADSSKEIWIDLSNVSNNPNKFVQCGTGLIEYYAYFKDFVDTLNEKLNQPDSQELYSTHYLISCTTPNRNNKLKRWESKVIVSDLDGDQVAVQKEPIEIPPEPEELPVSKTKGEKTEPKETKSEAVRLKELDNESKRLDAIRDINKLFMDDKITKLERKEMIAELQ